MKIDLNYKLDYLINNKRYILSSIAKKKLTTKIKNANSELSNL